MNLTTFGAFQDNLMFGGVDGQDFGGDLIGFYGGGQAGASGDGLGQCVEFPKQYIPCD